MNKEIENIKEDEHKCRECGDDTFLGNDLCPNCANQEQWYD